MKTSIKLLGAAGTGGLFILASHTNLSNDHKYEEVISKIKSGTSTLVCGNVPSNITYNNPPKGTMVTKNGDGTYTIAVAEPIRGNHSSKYSVRDVSENEAISACNK